MVSAHNPTSTGHYEFIYIIPYTVEVRVEYKLTPTHTPLSNFEENLIHILPCKVGDGVECEVIATHTPPLL